MIWQSEWEIKTKMFEYCEGLKALYGDTDPRINLSLSLSTHTHAHTLYLSQSFYFKNNKITLRHQASVPKSVPQLFTQQTPTIRPKHTPNNLSHSSKSQR